MCVRDYGQSSTEVAVSPTAWLIANPVIRSCGFPGQSVRAATKGVEVLRGLIICAHIHEAS